MFRHENIQPKGSGIIEPLTTRQRAYLKKLAHPLKPVHQIGKEGLTVPGVRAIREAFNTREVLKVKIQDSAPAAVQETGQELAAQLENTHLVQVIGRTLVLYRPDPDNPEIELP
jgi:RNA-binding protein